MIMMISYTLKTLPLMVQEHIIPRLKTKNIFTLYGPMGAGKTTLVKNILFQCGVTDTVVSPTFGYVNTYLGADNNTFYHFDLYRLSSLDEFINAGFDEILVRPHSYHLIEWPELIQSLLQDSSCVGKVQKIMLNYDQKDPSQRVILL